jgi:hypothetical protein
VLRREDGKMIPLGFTYRYTVIYLLSVYYTEWMNQIWQVESLVK